MGANDGLVSTSSLILGVAAASTEHADLALERQALMEHFDAELEELAAIYEARGLTPALATQVAEQLMASDALGAHARDEIGITETSQARPLQAAFSSAVTFTAGAMWPLLIAWWAPPPLLILLVALFSILFLAFLGAAAARVGGAPILKASVRVMFWGALAMALTFGIGRLFGVVA